MTKIQIFFWFTGFIITAPFLFIDPEQWYEKYTMSEKIVLCFFWPVLLFIILLNGVLRLFRRLKND